MPRYFFHLDRLAPGVDRFGVDLPGTAAAQAEAVRRIAEALGDDPADFWKADQYCMTVTDAAGLILFQIDMVAVLAAAMPHQSAVTGRKH